MTELLNAKKVLTEYIDTQIKLDDEYSLGNEKYINGLTDAVRIIDKIINKEIESMVEYYDEDDYIDIEPGVKDYEDPEETTNDFD